jgi:hypothetical protein
MVDLARWRMVIEVSMSYPTQVSGTVVVKKLKVRCVREHRQHPRGKPQKYRMKKPKGKDL